MVSRYEPVITINAHERDMRRVSREGFECPLVATPSP
jgi:hypothetical protein